MMKNRILIGLIALSPTVAFAEEEHNRNGNRYRLDPNQIMFGDMNGNNYRSWGDWGEINHECNGNARWSHGWCFEWW